MKPTPDSGNSLSREARFLALMLILSALAGVAYTTIFNWSLSLRHILSGGAIGLCIGAGCAAADLMLVKNFGRLRFTAMVFVGTTVYTIIGIFVVLGAYLFFGSWMHRKISLPPDVETMRVLAVTALITLAISFVASLFSSLRLILGRHSFAWLLMGGYREPKEETRVLMFLDLKNSVEIAERLGHVKYHRLIHKLWCDFAKPILEADGDIYKYVGDEVIVTWLLSEAKVDNRWVECVLKIREKIINEKASYKGLGMELPEFRTALHCGMVVAGEMGNYKREVGFVGDAVNVTSRILEVCKEKECDFLVSNEILKRIDKDAYLTRDIGEVKVRGRREAVWLHAIEGRSQEAGATFPAGTRPSAQRSY